MPSRSGVPRRARRSDSAQREFNNAMNSFKSACIFSKGAQVRLARRTRRPLLPRLEVSKTPCDSFHVVGFCELGGSL
jgi:hypothetical protein